MRRAKISIYIRTLQSINSVLRRADSVDVETSARTCSHWNEGGLKSDRTCV